MFQKRNFDLLCLSCQLWIMYNVFGIQIFNTTPNSKPTHSGHVKCQQGMRMHERQSKVGQK